MPNHATAILAGHLGKDPTERTTKSGDAMVSASLAVTRRRNGEQNTSWFSLLAFSGTADILAQAKKGWAVAIMGDLEVQEWTDRDGNRRTTVQVIARSILSMSPPRGASDATSRAPAAAHTESDTETGSHEGLPF